MKMSSKIDTYWSYEQLFIFLQERCVDKVQNLQELMTQSDISEEIVDLVTWVLDKPFQICLRKDIRVSK